MDFVLPNIVVFGDLSLLVGDLLVFIRVGVVGYLEFGVTLRLTVDFMGTCYLTVGAFLTTFFFCYVEIRAASASSAAEASIIFVNKISQHSVSDFSSG